MRFLHTSDIHIDSPLTTKLTPEKVRERKQELLRNFARLVNEARGLGAEAIIIAGDLFDTEKISKKAIDVAFDIIEKAEDIAFFYLQGNHEGEAFIKSGRSMPKNLLTFGRDWTYYQLDGVTVAGRSEIAEKMFDSLALPEESRNIVVLHGELKDRCAYPETVGLKDAAGKNIDYLALGHYHSFSAERIDDRGEAVYCGTPEGRGFDETGDKGYSVIDVTDRAVKYEFRSFAERRLHIVRLDLSGMTTMTEIKNKAEDMLLAIPRKDMVRIELVGRYEPSLWKDLGDLNRCLGGRFYYFEVKDSSRIAINPEDYKLDKSLKGEFIRTVSADPTLTDEEKEKIIACGINALVGEDLFD